MKLLLWYPRDAKSTRNARLQVRYQPSGEGGARLPPATPHSLQYPKWEEDLAIVFIQILINYLTDSMFNKVVQNASIFSFYFILWNRYKTKVGYVLISSSLLCNLWPQDKQAYNEQCRKILRSDASSWLHLNSHTFSLF